MQLTIYQNKFNEFFGSEKIHRQIEQAMEMIKGGNRIFFIGNGGSNSICSHMMEDFAKMLNYEAFAFSDPALITCFSNDYGYENAIAEWLRVYYKKEDILVAISSSGNSPNINNAVSYAETVNRKIITFTGFKPDNKLKNRGTINFYLNSESYGIVECFHKVIIHSILDTLHEANK